MFGDKTAKASFKLNNGTATSVDKLKRDKQIKQSANEFFWLQMKTLI